MTTRSWQTTPHHLIGRLQLYLLHSVSSLWLQQDVLSLPGCLLNRCLQAWHATLYRAVLWLVFDSLSSAVCSALATGRTAPSAAQGGAN